MKSKGKDQIGKNKSCAGAKSLASKSVSFGSASDGVGSAKSLGGPGQKGKRLHK